MGCVPAYGDCIGGGAAAIAFEGSILGGSQKWEK